MKSAFCVSISILLCTTLPLRAQDSTSLHPSRYSFQLTRILTKDGRLRTGWFLGTSGDTLLAQIAKMTERIPRSDLVRVDVERTPQRGSAALAGMFVGIYAGTAAALNAQDQPFLFIRKGDEGELAIYTILFGLAGGAIGNLIGGTATNVDKFDFSGDDAAKASAWEELVDGSMSPPHRSAFHLLFQGGWVGGPLPTTDKSGTSYYYYSSDMAGATSLNMVRKIQLTYSVTQFFDAGLALMWLGQPSVSHYAPSYSAGTMVTLDGKGRYAVGSFQPLWKLGLRSVQWDIGGGVGVASYECSASSPPTYYSADSVKPGISVNQKNSTISTMLYTEFKVFLSDYFSLGVAADWVYIPDEVPAVQGFTFESDNLGTSSIGFVLSFHL